MRIETEAIAALTGRCGSYVGRALIVAACLLQGEGGSAHLIAGPGRQFCSSARPSVASRPSESTRDIERLAERYVTLALALAQRSPDEIDAYFGPGSLKDMGASSNSTLQQLEESAQGLLVELRLPGDTNPRRIELQERVKSFDALLGVMLDPGKITFDQEARSLYDFEPAPIDTASLSGVRSRLEESLPGQGSLADRVDRFRRRFVIPAGARAAVFARALKECRAKTLAKWPLPPEETLDVTFTRDVAAAWHRYEGHYHSSLKLNPDAVAFLGSAIDVACHEGYPGHHTQFVLMELEAGQTGPEVEKTLVLLRSPISMLREGAADYGVDLVFPPAERLAFERDVLFPLAGLDPAEAASYALVNRLVRELSSSAVPILRAYRDHRLGVETAARELQEAALVSSPGPLLAFVDHLGPFVLGYTLVPAQVRHHIENYSTLSGEDRWSILRRILAREDLRALAPPGRGRDN